MISDWLSQWIQRPIVWATALIAGLALLLHHLVSIRDDAEKLRYTANDVSLEGPVLSHYFQENVSRFGLTVVVDKKSVRKLESCRFVLIAWFGDDWFSDNEFSIPSGPSRREAKAVFTFESPTQLTRKNTDLQLRCGQDIVAIKTVETPSN